MKALYGLPVSDQFAGKSVRLLPAHDSDNGRANGFPPATGPLNRSAEI